MRTEKEIQDKLHEWQLFKEGGMYPPDSITWGALADKITIILKWVLKEDE